jgi:hypothetical protein
LPKYLIPALVDDRPDWGLAPGAPQPYAIYDPTTAPKPEDLTTIFKIVVYDGRRSLPDIGVLRGTTTLVVSAKLRSIMEKYEPGVHFFVPVEIALRDGETIRGYHLFKIGRFTNDAIDAANSTVAPVRIAGQVRRYNEKRFPANLMWKASMVADRHIWSDVLMPSVLMVSDDVFADIVEQDISGYVSKESRINPAL